MAVDNDVDILFQKHSIAEVEEILVKTRNDIEKKKEDLRIMVGERYRDLIEAADTIAKMQESAKAISSNMQTVQGLCESLQQRGLIGFKTDLHRDLQTFSKSVEYSIAVQIKILLSASEILWKLSQEQNYLDACRIYLFAQHTHTVLQLSSQSKMIFHKFPFVNRQWATISQFHNIISSGCCKLLEKETNDLKALCNALAALVLINNYTLPAVLHKFLQLRNNSFDACLTSKLSSSSKDQIQEFMTLLVISLSAVHYAFIKNADGISNIEKTLKDVCEGLQSDVFYLLRPNISFLDESSFFLSFLPESISKFKPSLPENFFIHDSEVQNTTKSWLDQILKDTLPLVSNLLVFATSLKALNAIQQNAWIVLEKYFYINQEIKNVQFVCSSNFDPWEALIRPPILLRMKEIITAQLISSKNEVVEIVKTFAEECTECIPESSGFIKESNLNAFVWSESAGDIPDQIGWVLANSRSFNQTNGLYFKVHGFTHKIQSICNSLNTKLSLLVDELLECGQGCMTNNASDLQNNYIVGDDFKFLLSFLQNESFDIFSSLVTELEEVINNSTKTENTIVADDDPMTVILNAESVLYGFIGRLYHGIINLCPKLCVCLSAELMAEVDAVRKVSLGIKVTSSTWNMLLDIYVSSSHSLFGAFLSSAAKNFGIALKKQLSCEITNDSTIGFLPLISSWEAFEIEEENEEGQTVKSSICVPCHPMPFLIQHLSKLCSVIIRVIGNYHSRTVQNKFLGELSSEIINVYDFLINEFEESINQTIALQFIFDLNYVQVALFPKENKDLTDSLQEAIKSLEQKVDPFDLNVFSPHINLRVQLSAHRCQALLGNLISFDKKFFSHHSVTSPTSSVSSNISLPLIPVVDIPRFSKVLLPVSVSADMHSPLSSATSEILSTKTTITVKPAEMESSSLRMSRSVAAIFSDMSSSWFGSSGS